MGKWTVTKIKALKGKGRIACVTAYDYATARMADKAGMRLVLVGDSLATVVLGYSNTLPVTLDEMLHHTRAVVRGTENALVVADMPFMSYHVSPEQAVENAGRFVKEAGADAVKIEGGAVRENTVRALVRNGIPVLAHIGLTPQSIKTMGGYKIQGRQAAEARTLVKDARILQDAGAFAIVLECIPRQLGVKISKAVKIPTIGIGAGPGCDGQILVLHDLLGLQAEKQATLSFVRQYTNLGVRAVKALEAYRNDVETGRFPDSRHCF